MNHSRQVAADRLRARLTRARLHNTTTTLNRWDIEEVETAIKLLDEIRSYGPTARLRVNASGRATFTIYDPTKSAGKVYR